MISLNKRVSMAAAIPACSELLIGNAFVGNPTFSDRSASGNYPPDSSVPAAIFGLAAGSEFGVEAVKLTRMNNFLQSFFPSCKNSCKQFVNPNHEMDMTRHKDDDFSQEGCATIKVPRRKENKNGYYCDVTYVRGDENNFGVSTKEFVNQGDFENEYQFEKKELGFVVRDPQPVKIAVRGKDDPRGQWNYEDPLQLHLAVNGLDKDEKPTVHFFMNSEEKTAGELDSQLKELKETGELLKALQMHLEKCPFLWNNKQNLLKKKQNLFTWRDLVSSIPQGRYHDEYLYDEQIQAQIDHLRKLSDKIICAFAKIGVNLNMDNPEMDNPEIALLPMVLERSHTLDSLMRKSDVFRTVLRKGIMVTEHGGYLGDERWIDFDDGTFFSYKVGENGKWKTIRFNRK